MIQAYCGESGRRRIRGLVLGLGGLIAAGCGGGDGLPRRAVEGTVTYAGKPVEDGLIQFLPANASAPGMVAGGAVIEQGKYAIEGEKGLVPGTYLVTISASPPPSSPGTPLRTDNPTNPGEPPGPAPAPPPADLIPAKYNTQSKLTVEIKADGEPVDFKLDR